MAYALVEHLILTDGVARTRTISTHALIDTAIAARIRVQTERPELIGCVSIVPVHEGPPPPAVAPAPAPVTPSPKGT